MTLCSRCHRDVCKPCAIKHTRRPPKAIVVATDAELLRISHFRRLAMATRALHMPRREIPNWIADTLFEFTGIVTWPDGKLFEVDDDDIDLAFNDDGSFRWLSDFLRFADHEPAQSPQLRIISRLRLIDLAFRISDPELAAKIAR